MSVFLLRPDNLPLPRAGVYLLTNVTNGKRYVGISQDVQKRLYQHTRGSSPQKLRNALKKYGAQSFLAEPIFYALPGNNAELPIVEAILIQDYDSIRNGYNVQAMSEGIGPYGAVFSELIRSAYQRPEVRERLAAMWSSPAYRARHRAGIRNYASSEEGKKTRSEVMIKSWLSGTMRESRAAAFAKTEVKDRRRKSLIEAQNRPETVAKRRETLVNPAVRDQIKSAVTEAWADPALRAAQSERRKRYLADPTNRAANRQHLDSVRRTATLAAKAAIAGSVWVTDGTRDRRVSATAPLPEGWRLGRADKTKYGPPKGRPLNVKWITDGVRSATIPSADPVPDGWRPGRTVKDTASPPPFFSSSPRSP